jgi:hypothetical protein
MQAFVRNIKATLKTNSMLHTILVVALRFGILGPLALLVLLGEASERGINALSPRLPQLEEPDWD